MFYSQVMYLFIYLFIYYLFIYIFIYLFIQSPRLFSFLNRFVIAHESDLRFYIQKYGYNYARAEYYCSKIHLDGITHDQTITCKQFLTRHVVGSWSSKGRKNYSNDNNRYLRSLK